MTTTILISLGVVAAQQPPAFRSGVQTVSIFATVRSADGRLVPDLTRDDFTVLDNGKRQEIAVFRKDVVPITVAMLLDMSGSVEREVTGVRSAAQAFVDRLWAGDRMRIGTFGIEIALSPRLTGDHAYLRHVLAEEIWPGGPTPLWQAIDAAMTSLTAEGGRRVILLFTDGYNTGSPFTQGIPDVGLPAIERRVDREGFMIYVVGLPSTMRMGGNMPMNAEMKWLSVDSGGGFYEVRKGDDPAETMGRIADELHHQYSIGFQPQILDGKAHKIDVKVTRPGPGMKVRTRRAYIASPIS